VATRSPRSNAGSWFRPRRTDKLALAGYLWEEQAEAFTPHCLYVLTLQEDRIQEITAFVTPDMFQRFSLPASVAA
jgi:hypothetical protein